MKKLIKGIVDFREKSIEEYRRKFAKLSLEQKPDALMIACCDSRVVPNVFASSDPGDLFVLRNLGNLIVPYQASYTKDISSASVVEFSLTNLEVSDIIVCGHSECGAMYKLLEQGETKYNHALQPMLNEWLKNAFPSYQRFVDDGFIGAEVGLAPHNRLSRINVLQQMDNLKTYPLVQERLKNNTLGIHGWWFDLATADVYYYNHTRSKFIVINEDEAKNMLLGSG